MHLILTSSHCSAEHAGMIKINEAIESVISQSRELSFGFNQGLFNLTQLARFIRPVVATKVKREVSEKALLMALSRLQRRKAALDVKAMEQFAIERVSVGTGLNIVTYYKSRENQSAVINLYKRTHKLEGYMSVSEGSSEITLIIEGQFYDTVRELIPERPITERKGVVSVGIRFHKRYLNVPGYLYKILQVLTLQNINIWELSSTATEIVVYIDQKDTHLAMETIISSFRHKRAVR